MKPRRVPESTCISTAAARAQLALYLAQARPEMVRAVSVDELLARFRLNRAEIEEALARARQGRFDA